MSLNDILRMYSEGRDANDANASAHFEQVAGEAPKELVADGLSHAFRSDQTPPFGDMVANLFRNSAPAQRAGLLNEILGSLGGAGIGGALGGLLRQFGSGAITPDAASQVSPEQVKEMADQARNQNPSVVDRVSRFYADHPALVQALGSVALAMVLRHMGQRRAA